MFFFQDRRQTANLPEYEGEFPGFSARVYQIIKYYFFYSEKILCFSFTSINFDFNSIFKPWKARRSIITAELGRNLDQNILRRYVHMEKLINFYDQSISNITKYWTYGCWCFQMGDYPLRIGNGAPMDNVDK